jgi:carboxymethylenebutenolidase
MPGRYRPRDTAVAWSMLLTFIREVSDGEWSDKRVRWEFSCDAGENYDFSKNVRLE